MKELRRLLRTWNLITIKLRNLPTNLQSILDHYQQLKDLLRLLLAGRIAQPDLTRLVQISRVMVQSYLSTFRPSVFQLCSAHGLTLADMSYDCIGEIFAEVRGQTFYYIHKFASSLNESIESIPEKNLYLAYRSFLARVADKNLAQLYAKADPIGAKILRNIRDAVKGSACLELARDYRGFVILPVGMDLLNHLECFPVSQLERELGDSADKTMPELIIRLHHVLTGQAQYRRSATLLDVVKVFKTFTALQYQAESNPDYAFEQLSLDSHDLEQIKKQVELALKEKIITTYLMKGKIDKGQAEAMFFAFRDMFEDWISLEGNQRSLFHYLARHTDIDEQKYENDYRTRMEYLMRIAKDEFAAYLTGDL